MSDCIHQVDEPFQLAEDELDLVLGGSSVPSGAQESGIISWGSLMWDYAVWYVKDAINNPAPPSPNGTPDTGSHGASGQEGTGGAPGF